MGDAQTIKKKKRVKSGFPKYGEITKHGSCALRCHSRLPLSPFALVQARGIGPPSQHLTYQQSPGGDWITLYLSSRQDPTSGSSLTGGMRLFEEEWVFAGGVRGGGWCLDLRNCDWGFIEGGADCGRGGETFIVSGPCRGWGFFNPANSHSLSFLFYCSHNLSSVR